MGHVMEGNLSMPKNSCFLAFPIYWPVRNFNRFVFCASVMVGLDQNSLEISLSMSGFIVHLLMFGKRCAMMSKLVLRSCFMRYSSKHLTGPLSGLLNICIRYKLKIMSYFIWSKIYYNTSFSE